MVCPRTVQTLNEVIGDPMRYGEIISMGAVLPVLDLVAGRCSALFVGGRAVTGSFDQVDVFSPVRHGDLVAATALVLGAGTRSLLLDLTLTRDFLKSGKRIKQTLVRCHATFVALDDEDKDQVGDLQRKYKFCRRLFQSKDISQLASTAKENGGYAQMYNICHESMVESGLTLIKVRKQYLPRNENLYKVVFGGDILITLETAAVTCANQMYGGCKRFYCIGMRSVGFLHAVPVIQALEVHAKVVGCSQHVVCVLVYSYVDRKHDGSDMALCHHGVFHLASVSSKEMQAEKLIVGVKQPDVSEAEEEVRDFLRGMSLPLSTEVANAWNVEGDQFPMAPSGMT